MPTYSALTTLPGEDAAQKLAAAMERMEPEPTGVGVFEIEDGSGLWEVGGYFLEPPDGVMLEVLATAFGLEALEPHHPFANLLPCDNVFAIESDSYRTNPLVIQGPGAGREVTAAAIQYDLWQICASL